MASEWWQSRAQGTIHTRNCVLLARQAGPARLPPQPHAPAPGNEEEAEERQEERKKARAVRDALRDPAHYARWWPADLTVAPLAGQDDSPRRATTTSPPGRGGAEQQQQQQPTRIRVCSPLGACWEGVEWAYDRGAFRGRGVWSVSPSPSLSRCMADARPGQQPGLGREHDLHRSTGGGGGEAAEHEDEGDDGRVWQQQHWCVCYEADLEAQGRARLGMRLGLDLAHMQARGTDDLLSSLSALAERSVSSAK